jgi:hypothetical protein
MASGIEASTTVGVTGQLWRASVSPWGSVTPWGRSPAGRDASPSTLDWYVAADDRWHHPAQESAVRQRRIDGTPVIETRVRVPDGDAVQRVWAVADAGGLTIVEVENDSPLPFAVAFCGGTVLTERTPADIPIQGIDLPDDAITLPVGHRASVRVALAHGAAPRDVRLAGLPDAAAVARGWVTLSERASRLDLPDSGLAEAVVAARCDLMLDGPVDAAADPIGFVLDVAELVRLGDDAAPWLAEIIGPVESVARSDDPMLPAALVAAQRVADAAGDRRAARDIERLRRRAGANVAVVPLGPFSEVRRSGAVGRFVHDVERRLADGGDLLPTGIPTRWLGANFEIHDVPTSAVSTVSYAVRWHGDRPAVLWEQAGVAQQLTASAVDATWTSGDPAGEALWAAPVRLSASSKLSVTTSRISTATGGISASDGSTGFS